MTGSGAELEYYRAVEDLFAELRGTPHVFSPRDFQLLRGWWRDGIPLAAVTAGIVEVFARRRDAGEDDPVLSLAYCRHAVRRAAKRLAQSRAGTPEEGAGTAGDHGAALAALERHLDHAAEVQAARRPPVADCIRSIQARLALLDATGDPSAIESSLYSLETALLEGCWNALDRTEQLEIDERARQTTKGENGAAALRAVRAHRDQEVRLLLGLPRLELP